jgi:hypothetical protein
MLQQFLRSVLGDVCMLAGDVRVPADGNLRGSLWDRPDLQPGDVRVRVSNRHTSVRPELLCGRADADMRQRKLLYESDHLHDEQRLLSGLHVPSAGQG